MGDVQYWEMPRRSHDSELLTNGIDRDIENTQAVAERSECRLVLEGRDAMKFQLALAAEFPYQIESVGPNSAVNPPRIDAE